MAGDSVAGPAEVEQAQRVLPDPKPADKHGWWWGTGRRKTAVARVRIRPAKESGKGELKMQISRKQFKSVEEYFSELRDQSDAVAPIKVTDTEGKLDIFVRAHGGGYMGQAQAVRLGLARALVNYDPNFEPALREAGFLTRDARKVERKKYGQPGARARFQFSKR
ncbi:MAG: 30S ribosomal protein S9 [Phycisphaerae bacterium]|nr:30S ribosomal protein S9 [Phycisphaerae bacterium]MBM90528.1 30S ribosomal protein S9 [Phycisphaerae bacterium]HCT44560.1 30S ribosomal protein S9 [Phycisphaerales bacterium]